MHEMEWFANFKKFLPFLDESDDGEQLNLDEMVNINFLATRPHIIRQPVPETEIIDPTLANIDIETSREIDPTRPEVDAYSYQEAPTRKQTIAKTFEKPKNTFKDTSTTIILANRLANKDMSELPTLPDRYDTANTLNVLKKPKARQIIGASFLSRVKRLASEKKRNPRYSYFDVGEDEVAEEVARQHVPPLDKIMYRESMFVSEPSKWGKDGSDDLMAKNVPKLWK
ncbi:hypothetical protein Ciccas_008089 [Cichlidogyrus casuarinus]|uniref:Uncharacterized protein n=1 Tax=Cichlidogyrus casuarinus TaxID=1844966 RepID=A0ABD2Q547_9PLAT